jgi:predicted AAA+ superfamily ATPase
MPPSASFTRYLHPQIEADLAAKMVFIGGPRQVGKTRLGASIITDPRAYLNYDVAEHRRAMLAGQLPPTTDWFFDELHKYRGWRNFLKGLYDQWRGQRRILVTGSARLDLYRYGGDSLQGRYFHLRLHPLSAAEVGARSAGDLTALLELSGFPEPFFGSDATLARRWSIGYRERLVREEVASLENISDLDKLELLLAALSLRVGAPLSINALREDLQVSHPTLARWLDVLERLYAIFRLPPWTPGRGGGRLRALQKARKHYHYDWNAVREPAARFENLVASHLLKWVEFQIDTQGRALELRYFRDQDGREVDFVLLHDGAPVGFVECKLGDAPVSPALAYLRGLFPQAAAWQLSATGSADYQTPGGVRVAPALRLLEQLV